MKDVLFCDNHLLIVNKPAGLATQPSEHNEDNLTDRAKEYLKKKYQKPGAVFLEPIHRLDKPVSGLVLFARTSKALSRLQEAMRGQKIERIYLALIEKPLESQVLEHYLTHEEHKARVVSSTHPEGKKARLHLQALEKCKRGFLIQVQLETGRYHQIRTQLSFVGAPILGDKKYGSLAKWEEGKIALHHYKLSFPHPVTGATLEFTSPLSKEWGCNERDERENRHVPAD